MPIHELAGKHVPESMRPNIPRLISSYYRGKTNGPVSFGTSGHRGNADAGTFNEEHIVAIAAATAEVRQQQGTDGPMFIGMDTHALSEAAWITAIEVFGAYGIEIRYQEGRTPTPTPAVSRAILSYNAGRTEALADGVIITPSHNPPTDGGVKYNPPHGGPADSDLTKDIQNRANKWIATGVENIKRLPLQKALSLPTSQAFDFIAPYVQDLGNIIDMQAIAQASITIGADPMGGAGAAYWPRIAEIYGIDLHVIRETIDPAFMFMRLDWDGKIRMDCSSPYAMAGLIDNKDKFDISFGNDADFDRHGVVTPSAGLMNPNHYLSVAVDYLFRTRKAWPQQAMIGKTLVSSSMIDRVAAAINREVAEVPVGFKYFVQGLLNAQFGIGCEESAGASFLQKDGSVWTTDKDGILLNLLAAEIRATTDKDPGTYYQELEAEHGAPVYARIDAVASPEQKKILSSLTPDKIPTKELAGESIQAILTHAPHNHAAIGGIKIQTQNGWFAARPSGTEDVYKIYAESFLGEQHLSQIQSEAQNIVSQAFRG
jgi:phosphoglucomutase